MTLTGKIYLKNKRVCEEAITKNEEGSSWHDQLEACLVELCGKFDIPVPIWMRKNARELAIFKKTFFSSEQFIDKVWFDKLEIQLG